MKILQITNKNGRLNEFQSILSEIARLTQHLYNEHHIIINPFYDINGINERLQTFLFLVKHKCFQEGFNLVMFRIDEDETSWKSKEIKQKQIKDENI